MPPYQIKVFSNTDAKQLETDVQNWMLTGPKTINATMQTQSPELFGFRTRVTITYIYQIVAMPDPRMQQARPQQRPTPTPPAAPVQDPA